MELNWSFEGDASGASIDPGVGDLDISQGNSGTAQATIDSSAEDGSAVTFTLTVTPKDGSDPQTATCDVQVKAQAAPQFDPEKTGLRKRGEESGGTSLTIAKGEVVEAYWAVENADMVKLVRDDEDVGDPDRATDLSCPVPLDGLDPGDYTFKLVGGNASDGEEVWAEDSAVTLTLSLQDEIAVTKFEGAPEPDEDGKDHPPLDLQLAEGTKVKLSWETAGAKQVLITKKSDDGEETTLDPQDVDDSGAGSLVDDPQDKPTSYTIVAVNDDVKSDVAGPLSVSFHSPDDCVSAQAVVHPPASASLAIYAFDETEDKARAKLMIGAEDNVYLKWTVAGAKSARITAKLLIDKDLSGEQVEPTSSGHVANLSIVQHGIDLQLDDDGTGSDAVTVDPGPEDSTQYTLEVTPLDEKADPVTAMASARVANFNIQVEMPDGSGLATEKDCVLEVPDHDPFKGKTNEDGELWLNLPNLEAPSATLRLFDGDPSAEIANWVIAIKPEPGVQLGVTASDTGDETSGDGDAANSGDDGSPPPDGGDATNSSAEETQNP